MGGGRNCRPIAPNTRLRLTETRLLEKRCDPSGSRLAAASAAAKTRWFVVDSVTRSQHLHRILARLAVNLLVVSRNGPNAVLTRERQVESNRTRQDQISLAALVTEVSPPGPARGHFLARRTTRSCRPHREVPSCPPSRGARLTNGLLTRSEAERRQPGSRCLVEFGFPTDPIITRCARFLHTGDIRALSSVAFALPFHG